MAVDKSQDPTDCWPETSIPCHMDLSKGLLTTQQIASFRVRVVEGGGGREEPEKRSEKKASKKETRVLL